jgi:hypothetical protein
MYQSYDLSRYVDGDLSQSNSFTVSDHDTVSCAHMLAAGFNTMSRISMGGFVLAVVDTEAGTVQYDGKIEPIARPEPAKFGEYKQTFKIEPSVDADTIISILAGDGKPVFSAFGKVSVEPEAPYEPKSKYEHIARSVLESAYAELQAVKEVLFDAGVETIPADAGVRKLGRRLEHEYHAHTAMEAQHAQENESARAEMVQYVRGAYLKKERLTVDDVCHDLEDRFRGMLDVLSKFLVVIGEADPDEGHAVARRLCGISDE